MLPSSAAKDDLDYLAHLYLDHYRLMYRVAMSKLKNHHDTEDVLNNTILEMRKHIGLLKSLTYEEQQKYLYRSVTNTAYRKAMDHNRLTNLINLDEDSFHDDRISMSAESEYFEQSEVEELLAALTKLPQNEFDLFIMKYINEWSDEEIGEILSVTPSSVRVYLARMREHARTILRGRDINE